jgi:hypothetical protein
MDQLPKWEYQVHSFGGTFGGPKDEDLEAVLNQWGEDGWEVVAATIPPNSTKVKIIAKRLLTRSSLRQRDLAI